MHPTLCRVGFLIESHEYEPTPPPTIQNGCWDFNTQFAILHLLGSPAPAEMLSG
jgi:hypothetical protein